MAIPNLAGAKEKDESVGGYVQRIVSKKIEFFTTDARRCDRYTNNPPMSLATSTALEGGNGSVSHRPLSNPVTRGHRRVSSLEPMHSSAC